MNIDELTLGQIKQLQSMLSNGDHSSKSRNIGKVCLIRTYSAGVHYGLLVEKDGTNVVLEDSRRIRSWKGAFTLSEIAINGAKEGTRIAIEVPTLELTQAIEIIPMSKKAIDSLGGYGE